MMFQCINEKREKMSFMRMTLPIHSYLDNLCLACNLENNNIRNYALRVYGRSLNYRGCVIPVPELSNRPFRSSNLFGCVIPVPKLANHPFRSSNLFCCVTRSPNLILSLIWVKIGHSKNFISKNNS
jgi:hypothetical protein